MEMMVDKKQIWAIFLFEFKTGHNVAETTCNINNASGPGTANERTVQWWFTVLQRNTRAFMMRNAMVGHQKMTATNRELILLRIHKLPKNSTLTTLWSFGI